MINTMLHNKYLRLVTSIFGAFVLAFAVNVIVVPQGLYSGGLYGVCQLLRTILIEKLGFHFGLIDIAGIMYYILNIPILILSMKNFGRKFVIRLFVTLSAYSLFVAIIPSPSSPFIEDSLTSCLIAGMLGGFGSGLILTCGCSTGGLDCIGLYLSKKGSNFTIGKFSIWFNFLLYIVCALLFSINVAIYSIIYTVFSNLFLDRIHQQNITVQLLIFTKDKSQQIQQAILQELQRGVTVWSGKGAYTNDDVTILCVCLSKYEVASVRNILAEFDPNAFITVQEGVHTYGLFSKHLI